MTRLITVEALSQSQITRLRHLRNTDGHCTCGRALGALSAKFIFCNAVTENPHNRASHESLIMGAYCFSCATEINNVLKRLKGSAYGSR